MRIPEERFRPTKDEVTMDLLKSIAMDEAAIANVLSAEADKVRAFVGKQYNFPTYPTNHEIMKFNNQIYKIVDVIVMEQWLMLRKMENVMEFADTNNDERDFEE